MYTLPISPSDQPALENILKHIENKLPWIERLDIVTPPAPASKELDVENDSEKIDPDDDFKRENYFYRIGQAAVLKAIPQMHALGVPTKRPADYFAEMVKSDEHMDKTTGLLSGSTPHLIRAFFKPHGLDCRLSAGLCELGSTSSTACSIGACNNIFSFLVVLH
ncbi:unnamed protein product [Echinostoma caproni]|uniref:N-acetyltransferase domain-containing protein n=1 Tax=Echinostoma caproni TaxID=27848 RepID=A0A183AZ35_9TREM|nr:unnamed protein product [Echinostoma caproni]